jgi:antitoxin (DNA-binding transcriptional repressor) of toxin-antitoxin stability system
MQIAIQIDMNEAKKQFLKLLALAHAGQETVLSKDGIPYARIMPLAAVMSAPKRQSGRTKGIIDHAFFEPLSNTELNAWEKG